MGAASIMRMRGLGGIAHAPTSRTNEIEVASREHATTAVLRFIDSSPDPTARLAVPESVPGLRIPFELAGLELPGTAVVPPRGRTDLWETALDHSRRGPWHVHLLSSSIIDSCTDLPYRSRLAVRPGGVDSAQHLRHGWTAFASDQNRSAEDDDSQEWS